MNPAIHVAHYAMAGVAARNHTGAIIQSGVNEPISLWLIVLLIVLVGFAVYVGCNISHTPKQVENEYRSMRINQLSKSLKK